MIFVFGDCELDLDRFELRRAGQLRPVEPQVFDLPAVLLRERHRLVASADEAAQADPAASVPPTPPVQEIRFCTAGDGTRLAYAASGAGPAPFT